MTEKQIARVQLQIKKQRAALVAERKMYGGIHDGGGRRYGISDLYMKIADYKGAIVYKRWFDKTFPDDCRTPLLSLNWAVSYFELGKIKEAKAYTLDVAFHNWYLFPVLLGIGIQDENTNFHGYDMLDHARELVEYARKNVTKNYLAWLNEYISTEEYKTVTDHYIDLERFLEVEPVGEKRSEIVEELSCIRKENISSNKR